jgi:hypothetical protein
LRVGLVVGRTDSVSVVPTLLPDAVLSHAGLSHAVLSQSMQVETFLGEDLLAWLMLAIGGALALGTLLALLRPPPEGNGDGTPQRPPLARSVVMIGIGLIAAVWGAASLFA